MDIAIHYVKFLRVTLSGPVASYPWPVLYDIEANEIAHQAYKFVCGELGINASFESEKQATNLRSRVRAHAVDLWGQIGTHRPPLSQIFRGVDKFVFMDQIVQSN